METLEKFLKVDEPFAWFIITGESGMGKSRLIFDLYQKNQSKYDCIFLNENNMKKTIGKKDGDEKEGTLLWNPRKPTLFIVDDFNNHFEEVKKLLITLSNANLKKSIKVILCEKTNNKEIAKSLNKQSKGDGQKIHLPWVDKVQKLMDNNSNIEECLFGIEDTPVLHLEGINEEDAKKYVKI